MRRLLQYLTFVAVAAMGTISCTESDINENLGVDNSNKLTLSAAIPSAEPITKVGFTDNDSEGIALSWEAGDSFTLYDSEGEAVDTFTNALGDSDFTSSKDDLVLTPEAEYTAVFGGDNDLTQQAGDAITSLNDACHMEATFTYGVDEVIKFEHKMAIMTFKFKSETSPYMLIFNNGSDDATYKVVFEDIQPSAGGIYTSHIMINPCEATERTVTFSLYADGATEPYDIRMISTSKPYIAGRRYTSPLSDLEDVAWAGSGTSDDPYKIETAAHLRRLSYEVSAGNKYQGQYFIMTQDIDLGGIDAAGNGIEGKEFEPIGIFVQNSTEKKFNGNFNGDNHEVSGLYINKPESDYVGLFGCVSGSRIENLNVSGRVKGASNVGGIAGYASSATSFISCYSSVSVEATASVVGGIAGYTSYATFDSCHNVGSVTSSGDNVGGIAGSAANSPYISGCINEGLIDSEGSKAGGIIGKTVHTSILMCYNSANISGSGVIGGIVGSGEGVTSVTSCYNSGEITGARDYIGGIAGAMNVDDTPYVNAMIQICYNVGNVTSADGMTIGSIAGQNGKGGEISNSYFKAGTCADGGVGKNKTEAVSYTTEMSDDEMKAAKLLTALNNASFNYNSASADDGDKLCAWKADDNGGYPTFDYTKKPTYTEIITELTYDEATDTYLIPTAEALRDFAAKVNGEDNTINGKLTDNIDLDNVEFTPIGSKDLPFKGSFNGDGCKISGLYINQPDKSYQALFGYIESATIENLGVSGSVTGDIYTAGIVAYAMVPTNGTPASIISCYNEATVVSINSGSAAGIAGYAYDYTIDSCYNVGDIIGQNTEFGCSNVAGIAGYVDKCRISSCYNEGAVTSASNQIAGIVATMRNTSIIHSYNKGNIGDSDNNREYVGGIAGKSAGTSSIAACYNSGDIVGNKHCGGIAGSIESTAVAVCYSVGNIVDVYRSGAIIGYGDSSSEYSNCYYLSGSCVDGAVSASSSDASGTAHELSEESMKSSLVLTLLNNASVQYNEANTEAPQICAWRQAAPAEYPSFDFDNEPTHSEIETSLRYDEASDTYLIDSAEALRDFSTMVGAVDNTINGKLTANIDLGDVPFSPIGGSLQSRYEGSFDGAGYKVSGLNINTPEKSYVGLFGFVRDATITNIGVSGNVTGNTNVGGLVGCAYKTNITACYSEVNVIGNQYVGSLVGGCTYSTNTNVNITSCYSTGSVSSTNPSSLKYAGGILGGGNSYVAIRNCYSVSSVVGSSYIGGIVGNLSFNFVCEVCYSATEKNSNSNSYSGSLLGKVAKTGANGRDYTLLNAYFDKDLWETGAGLYAHVDGMITGNTTEEMKDPSFVNTLNFAAALFNSRNSEYPEITQLIQWKAVPGSYPTLDFESTPRTDFNNIEK